MEEGREGGDRAGRRATATGKLELVPEGVVEVQSENSRGPRSIRQRTKFCLDRSKFQVQ